MTGVNRSKALVLVFSIILFSMLVVGSSYLSQHSSAKSLNRGATLIFDGNLTTTTSTTTLTSSSSPTTILDTLAVALEASPDAIALGNSTTLTATASGGSGNYTYTFTDSNGDNLSSCTITTTALSATCTDTPAANDTYNITVTDSLNDIAYASANVTVNQTISTTSTTPIQPLNLSNPYAIINSIPVTNATVQEGQQIKITIQDAGATGGTPPYTYQWLESSNGGPLANATDCGAGNSQSVGTVTNCTIVTTPANFTKGKYVFQLEVTDASGNIDPENFTLIITGLTLSTSVIFGAGNSTAVGTVSGGSGYYNIAWTVNGTQVSGTQTCAYESDISDSQNMTYALPLIYGTIYNCTPSGSFNLTDGTYLINFTATDAQNTIDTSTNTTTLIVDWPSGIGFQAGHTLLPTNTIVSGSNDIITVAWHDTGYCGNSPGSPVANDSSCSPESSFHTYTFNILLYQNDDCDGSALASTTTNATSDLKGPSGNQYFKQTTFAVGPITSKTTYCAAVEYYYNGHTLETTEDTSDPATATINVTAAPQAPPLTVTITPTSKLISADQNVTFTPNALGGNPSKFQGYAWSVPAGLTALNGCSPYPTFSLGPITCDVKAATSGNYVITVYARDSPGNTVSANAILTVTPALVTTIGANWTYISADQKVSFTNTTTGGTGSIKNRYTVSPSGPIINGNIVTFPSSGYFTVTLTSNDTSGEVSTNSIVINVTPSLDITHLTPNRTYISEDQKISFTNDTTGGTGSKVFSYSLGTCSVGSVTVTFINNTALFGNVGVGGASCVVNESVTDKTGEVSHTTSSVITITPPLQEVFLNSTRIYISADQSVKVYGVASSGTGNYTFTLFVNGQKTTPYSSQTSGGDYNATLTFNPGTYNISLGVKDTSGEVVNSSNIVVTVAPVLTIKLNTSNTHVIAGHTVIFTNTTTGGTGGNVYSYIITAITPGGLYNYLGGNRYSFTAPFNPTLYNVTEHVTDASGEVNQSSLVMFVNESLQVNQSNISCPPGEAAKSECVIPTFSRDQLITINDSGAFGGTPPYTFQWLEILPNTITKITATNCGAGDSPSTGHVTPCLFQTTNTTTLGQYNFILSATDSENPAQVAYETEQTLNLNASLVISSFAGNWSYISPDQHVHFTNVTVNGTGGDAWAISESSGPQGGMTPVAGKTNTYNFTQPGNYIVKLYATDISGENATAYYDVNVTQPLVTTLVNESRLYISVGQSVAFTNVTTGGTGSIVNHYFVDGLPVTLVGGSILFSAPGTYAVTLGSTDATGEISNSSAITVTVTPVLPAPVLTANRTDISSGQGVKFSYTEGSGGTGSNVYSYSVSGGTYTITGNLINFTTPDTTYTVTLDVSDASGETNSSNTQTITVTTVLPAPVLTASTNLISSGQGVTFSYTEGSGGTGSNVYNYDITGGAYTIGADGLINFTTPDTTYTVTLDVSDASGETNQSNVQTITVTPVLPAPVLTASRTDISSGQGVTFSYTEGSGGTGSNVYNYDITGGTYTIGADGLINFTTPDVTYTVVLDVSDASGETNQSNPITVTVTPVLQTALTNTSRLYISAGQGVFFTNDTMGGTGSTQYSYDITGGAYTIGQGGLINFTTPDVTYTVVLDVSDASGETNQSNPITVTVTPVLATQISASTELISTGQAITFTNTTTGGTGGITNIYSAYPTAPTWYYTGYTDGGYSSGSFYRSAVPITAAYSDAILSENYTGSALDINLTQSTSNGYDLGFYYNAGTLGSLAANGTSISGTGSIETNLWIDVQDWTWTSNTFTGLGSDGAYGLGSVQGAQAISGSTSYYITAGPCAGSTYTVSQLADGACATFNAETPVDIWIGVGPLSGAGSQNISVTVPSAGVSVNNNVITFSTPGNYLAVLTTTDASGEVSTSDVAINVTPPLVFTSFTSNREFISAGQYILFTNTTSGGTGSNAYTYTITGPGGGYTQNVTNGNIFNFTIPGTYTVTENVADLSGETNVTDQITITVTPALVTQIDASTTLISTQQSITFSNTTTGGTGGLTNVYTVYPTAPTRYYTGYTDGGYSSGSFYRSAVPITAAYSDAILSENYTGSALDINLTQSTSNGYDLGFYQDIGTLGSLAANGFTISGTGSIENNLWINVQNWTWSGDGTFTGLGSDGAYGLGSVQGAQTVSGSTSYYITAGPCAGSTYTVSELASGACPSFNSDTPIAIWVGVGPVSGAGSQNISVTSPDAGVAVSGNVATFDTAGSYSAVLTTTDISGEVSTSDVAITVTPPLTINLTANRTLISVDQPVTLSYTTTGGTGSNTYYYTVDRITQGEDFAFGSPGIQNVTIHVTDASGEVNQSTVFINVTPALTITSFTNASRTYISTGQAVSFSNMTVNGTGNDIWTLFVNNLPAVINENNGSVTFSTAGNYVVTLGVKDKTGEIYNTTGITVDVAPPLRINLSASTNYISVGQSVKFTNITYNGTGNNTYSYTVSGPEGGYVQGENGNNFTFVTVGNYIITENVADASGETNQSNAQEVNVTPVLEFTSFTGTTPISLDQAATFTNATAGGTGTNTYYYTIASGPVGGTMTYMGHNMFTFSVPGSYVVQINVEDLSGETNSSTFSVTVNPELTVAQLPLVDIDQGQNYTYYALASNGTMPYSYSWTVGSGLTIKAGCGTAESCTVTGTTVGYGVNAHHVSVTVGDASAGTPAETATTSVAMNVYPPLSVKPPTSSHSLVDQGQLSVESSSVIGGAPPYRTEWLFESPPNVTYVLIPGSVQISNSVITQYIFLTNSSTEIGDWEYEVSVIDSSVFPEMANAINQEGVTVYPALNATTQATPVQVSPGNSSSLTATINGGSNPANFDCQWYAEMPGSASYSTIPGATSCSGYTFSTSPGTTRGTWLFKVVVTDTGTTVPEVINSSTSAVTVGHLGVSLAASSQTIDSGQSEALTATTTGGTPPYTYAWNGLDAPSCDSTTNSLTDVCSFTPTTISPEILTYDVMVTDATANVQSAAISITLNPAPTATITALTNTLDAGQAETYTITISGGTGPFHVTLYNVTSNSPTPYTTTILSPGGSSAISIIAGATGNFIYSADITDEGTSPQYSFSSGTTSVRVNPDLGSLLTVIPQDIDIGGSATLTASVGGGSSPYTYYFNVTKGGTALFTEVTGPTASQSSDITYTANAAAVGTDTVNVKVIDGTYSLYGGNCYPAGDVLVTDCEILTNTIIVNNPITVTFGPESPIDIGQSQTLTAIPSGGSGVYSYAWYQGSSCTGTVIGTSNTLTTPELASTTTYCVEVEDSLSGTGTGTITVDVNNGITVTATAVPTTLDIGNSASISASATGGSGSYSWTWTAASCPGYSSGTGSSATYSPVSATTGCAFTFTATDTLGGSGSGTTQSITVNPQITISGASATSTVDAGQAVALSAIATGGNGYYTTEQWYVSASDTNSSGTAVSGSGLSATDVESESGTYYYYLVVSDGNSSTEAISAPIAVTVNPDPAVSLGVEDAYADSGQNDVFTATASGGTGTLSYNWVLPVGVISNASDCTLSSATCTIAPSVSSTTLEQVSVSVTDSLGETSAPSSESATYYPALTVTLNANPSIMMQGSPTTLTANVLGGSGTYSYTFTDTNDDSALAACTTGPTSATSVYCSDMPALIDTYTVTVSDGLGGTATQSAIVTVTTTPANAIGLTLTPSVSTIYISNAMPTNSIEFTELASGGIGSYTYNPLTSNAPAGYYLVTGSGAGQTITFSAPGTFTVSGNVVDSNNDWAYATTTVNVIYEVNTTGGNTLIGIPPGVTWDLTLNDPIGVLSLFSPSGANVLVSVSNVTNSIALLASNSSGTFTPLTSILKVNVTTITGNTVQLVNVTLYYACGSSNVVPYMYNSISGGWSPIQITGSTGSPICSVTFNIPADPIFAAYSYSATTSAPATSGGGGNTGGGGGGGGGGGPTGPTVTQVGTSCYMISNMSQDNQETLAIYNTTFNVVDNFISPNDTGVSVNNVAYTLYMQQPVSIGSNNGYNYTIELENLSYTPIQDTVELELCGQSQNTQQPLVQPNTTVQTPPATTTILPPVPTVNTTAAQNSTISIPSGSGGSIPILPIAVVVVIAIGIAAGAIAYTRTRK